jgi:hypothetical protein
MLKKKILVLNKKEIHDKTHETDLINVGVIEIENLQGAFPYTLSFALFSL